MLFRSCLEQPELAQRCSAAALLSQDAQACLTTGTYVAYEKTVLHRLPWPSMYERRLAVKCRLDALQEVQRRLGD